MAHLDRLFVFKARLTSELPIVNLGHFAREELEALAKQWDAVIGQAQETPERRAVIVLLITIGQRGIDSVSPPDPRPNHNDDHALQKSIVRCHVRLAPSLQISRPSMLKIAG